MEPLWAVLLRRANPRLISGILLLLLGALFFVISLGAPPPRSALKAEEGVLEQVAIPKGGKGAPPLRFRLRGSPRDYQYISKAGEMGQVEDALSRMQSAVRVLVDPRDDYSTIYGIAVDGRTVRSYDQVAAAWKRDDQIGFLMAGILAILGVAFLRRSARSSKNPHNLL